MGGKKASQSLPAMRSGSLGRDHWLDFHWRQVSAKLIIRIRNP
jgi:hypothetical protein